MCRTKIIIECVKSWIYSRVSSFELLSIGYYYLFLGVYFLSRKLPPTFLRLGVLFRACFCGVRFFSRCRPDSLILLFSGSSLVLCVSVNCRMILLHLHCRREWVCWLLIASLWICLVWFLFVEMIYTPFSSWVCSSTVRTFWFCVPRLYAFASDVVLARFDASRIG